MGIVDDIRDKAEQLAGKAKQEFGKLTNQPDVEAEGGAQQATGEVREAGHDLQDKAADAVNEAKKKLTGE